MALTSALYTGLSGLDVNQTALNIIGNNIANSNTVAYKSSNAVFEPQFYVTNAGATAPTADSGGTNPDQTGLGATVATVDTNFSAGSLESTGVPTDMAIDGAGFFITQGATQEFTQDGQFTLNANNQLVTQSGQFVQGYGVNSSYSIVPGALQNITIPVGSAISAQATQNVDFQGNLNAGGMVATGASVLDSQSITTVGGGVAPTGATLLTNVASTSDPATPLFTVGQVFTLNAEKGTGQTTPETFTVTATSTLSDLTNFFQGSLGINTAATNGNPATPIPGVSVVPETTDPTSAEIIIVGNTGTDNALSLTAGSFTTTAGAAPLAFTPGADANGIASDPNGESIDTSALVYDSLGTPITVGVSATLESTSSAGTTWQFTATSPDSMNGNQVVGSGTLTFDNNGTLLSSSGDTVTIDRTGTGAKTPFTFNLNFSNMTALSSSQGSNMVMSSQDGSPIGSLTSYAIGTDGTITGSFSNGLTRTLGQVAVANFNNPQGLSDEGDNMYTSTADSGVPIIGVAGSNGTGTIRAGTLELSNVDLSQEFTNLIVASTGFSAASRVISTSDELLTDLLQSAR